MTDSLGFFAEQTVDSGLRSSPDPQKRFPSSPAFKNALPSNVSFLALERSGNVSIDQLVTALWVEVLDQVTTGSKGKKGQSLLDVTKLDRKVLDGLDLELHREVKLGISLRHATSLRTR